MFEDYKYGTLPRFRLKKSAQYNDHDINPELRQKLVQIDTKNILFICGGAFVGLDRIIEKRMKSQTLGFSASKQMRDIDKANILKYVTPSDIKSFGLIPELIGRMPIVTYLEPLDRNALLLILTEPKNAITKQYIKLFEIDGVKLKFDKKAFEIIVDKALEFELGARGLRSICESVMLDAMYEFPSEKKQEGFCDIK